jgi:hypothetical protein
MGCSCGFKLDVDQIGEHFVAIRLSWKLEGMHYLYRIK